MDNSNVEIPKSRNSTNDRMQNFLSHNQLNLKICLQQV